MYLQRCYVNGNVKYLIHVNYRKLIIYKLIFLVNIRRTNILQVHIIYEDNDNFVPLLIVAS